MQQSPAPMLQGSSRLLSACGTAYNGMESSGGIMGQQQGKILQGRSSLVCIGTDGRQRVGTLEGRQKNACAAAYLTDTAGNWHVEGSVWPWPSRGWQARGWHPPGGTKSCGCEQASAREQVPAAAHQACIDLALRCSCPPACFRSLQCPGPNKECVCLICIQGPCAPKSLQNSTHLLLQVSARSCPAAACTWSPA